MLIDRMLRAAMLQAGVYEEVEADEGATTQAALVILLVAIATAIGVFLSDVLGGLINFVVAIWLLIAGIVAIRQALDFDTGKAIGTAIIGWIALVIVTAI